MTTRLTPPSPDCPDSERDVSDLDSGLLERYWLRETTSDETLAVTAWSVANPVRWARYEAIREQLARPTTLEVSDADVQRMVTGVLDATHPPMPVRARGAQRSKIKRHARLGFGARAIWSGAGVIAGVAIVGAVLQFRAPGARGAKPATYVTGNGQRATITLPDGSTVALNVASRLEVPADYATGNRALRLHGEGLFTVVHGKAHPLTVTAGGTTTRVLGTSFVVRRYDADSVTTVAVRDGKVAVGSAVVGRMQVATVRKDGAIRLGVADSSVFGFPSGLLAMEMKPIADAIPELNRWYNADIRLSAPAVGRKEIKGLIPAGSLGDLKELLEMMGFRVVRNGQVLTLYPRAE